MRSWSLADVADVEVPPVVTTPAAAAVAAPRQPRAAISRRTVLQALTLSAATIGWTAVGWTLPSAQRKAYAETGPGGLTGWNSNTCADAYPSGYGEQASTDGSGYPAACYGSSRIGPAWCSSGWFKSGTFNVYNGHDYYTPISTACGASTTKKNAWRWSTGGHIYRCSDGNYSYDRLGGARQGPYFAVCQYRVS
jgi:hypothetical protein